MLNSYKNYLLVIALIGTFFYAGLMKIKNIKLEAQLQTCNANYAVLQDKIRVANELKSRQEKELRLREQEAAKARAESLKRKDLIMKTEIKGGCQGANDFMIQQALQFHWDNNIP